MFIKYHNSSVNCSTLISGCCSLAGLSLFEVPDPDNDPTELTIKESGVFFILCTYLHSITTINSNTKNIKNPSNKLMYILLLLFVGIKLSYVLDTYK